MALTPLGSKAQYAYDTATGLLHIVSVSGAGVVTDLGTITEREASDISYLAGPSAITVDSTLNGKTLATLLGTALNASLKVLTFTNTGSVPIYYAAGNASATGCAIIQPGAWFSRRVTKAQADTFKFFCATTCTATVDQEG